MCVVYCVRWSNVDGWTKNEVVYCVKCTNVDVCTIMEVVYNRGWYIIGIIYNGGYNNRGGI